VAIKSTANAAAGDASAGVENFVCALGIAVLFLEMMRQVVPEFDVLPRA